MNYNNYYPSVYNGYYNPYYQQLQQMQQMQQTQQPQQQVQQSTIQQSGFVLVQSEQDARTYPVAPGNSITFKDERLPYCYVKTMGFNQLDQPIFEKYRLVKEEEQKAVQPPAFNTENFVQKSELESIWAEINELKGKFESAQKEKKEDE